MSLPLTLSVCKEKIYKKDWIRTPVGKKSIISAQILVNLVMTLIGISILIIVWKDSLSYTD